jgi:hypothetical protein
MVRWRLVAAFVLCAACGSPQDPEPRTRRSASKKPKVILAYEVSRQPGESLRGISQRYNAPLHILERFNPREGHGRHGRSIYIPVASVAKLKPPFDRKPPRIVKVMRDPFLVIRSEGKFSQP